jgi:hypothetical protein
LFKYLKSKVLLFYLCLGYVRKYIEVKLRSYR